MRIIALAAAATLAMGAAAYADNEIDDDIRVAGTTVTFEEIEADQSGYIVIHEVANGVPVVPGSLAHAPVLAGDNDDLAVTLDAPLTPGAGYVAMLHVETNGNSTYDFGEGSTDVDTPVLDDGEPEMEMFAAPSN
ncbi:MAG: hypothetical protein H7Y08_07115 [Rhizobiaceae bacterium]|nr:hypothetical protein [Rhizobiaceae bacterium]